jgi:hypothetical protein
MNLLPQVEAVLILPHRHSHKHKPVPQQSLPQKKHPHSRLLRDLLPTQLYCVRHILISFNQFLHANLLAMPQQPIPPTRKQWYDKLADAILGDEDANSSSGAASRYALICQKCFAHNGLVKESVWLDTRKPSTLALRTPLIHTQNTFAPNVGTSIPQRGLRSDTNLQAPMRPS